MIKTNYHTHNQLCDGKGPISEYIQAAKDKGFTALGFSSHAPLPVENDWTLNEERLQIYLSELRQQKIRHASELQIYTGLEIDYIPGSQTPADPKYKNMGLDFSIGSVHSTSPLDINPEYRCVDGPVEDLEWLFREIHGGSFENLSETYYTRVAELVRIGGFSILGHLDLIKKRNRGNQWFRESAPWYERHISTVLGAIAKSGVIVEVNTGGIARGAIDTVYPSPWIIARAVKLGIPFTISADAHRSQDIDCYFDESAAILRENGCREIHVLLDGRWTTTPL